MEITTKGKHVGKYDFQELVVATVLRAQGYYEMVFKHSTDADLKQLAREIKNKYKAFGTKMVFERLKKKRTSLQKDLETQPVVC